jgi:predicted dehydrogenase
MVAAYVVGLGNAGLRLIRTCHATGIAVKAVYDVARNKRDRLKGCGLIVDSWFGESLAATGCDLLVVATPEWERGALLIQAAQMPHRVRRVLCEKPIVARSSELDGLRKYYRNDELAVHFVERHSRAVENLLAHVAANGLHVSRGSFRWGKYRISEPRPTEGVLADVCHPVDLLLLMAGVPRDTPFSVTANGVVSNFASCDQERLDTINLSIVFATGLTINGVSSYIWSSRQRCIEMVLSDRRGNARQLAILEFDNPRWDNDRLTIVEIDDGRGVPETLLDERYGDGVPLERSSIVKTCCFIEENLKELSGGTSTILARLDDAAYVQTIMDALVRECQTTSSSASFAGPEGTSPTADRRVSFLQRYLRDLPVSSDEFMWDEGF